MTASYYDSGIRFQYPEGWGLGEEDSNGYPTVTVFGPGGAFWSVGLHPRDCSPDDLVAAAVEAMSKEYDSLETHPLTCRFDERGAVACEMNFICFDLTGTAEVHGFYSNRGTCVVFYQAEDRDFDRLRDVFAAMCASLELE